MKRLNRWTIAAACLAWGAAWCAPVSVELDGEAQCAPVKAHPAGVSVTLEDGVFRIEYSGAAPVSVRLAEVTGPGLAGGPLLYRAQIRAEGLAAPACLEMLCRMGEGEYFSRALHETVQGTGDWRISQTPFQLEPGQTPAAITLGVLMQGAGTVLVRAPALEEGASLMTARVLQQKGLLWIVAGSLLGVALGVWGSLAGALAPRGQARGFVLGLGVVLWLAVVMALAYGVMLVVQGAPWAGWYPFVLAGGLGTVLLSGLLPLVRHRYQQAELRRMAAMDLDAEEQSEASDELSS